MSAEERRHEDAPKKIDERVISEERLSWIRTLGSEWSSALAQELARAADGHPEIKSVAARERDETRDRLLFAINDTQNARRIRASLPAEDRPHAPACAEPPKSHFHAGAEVQPSARLVQRAAAARATGAFLVQASRAAASMPLMPAAAAPSRHPAPPETDSNVEKDKVRDSLLRAISATEIAVRLGGEIAASNPQSRMRVQTSPQAASATLMPPPTAPLRRQASATTSMIEAAIFAAIPQVPSPPQAVVAAVSAPADIAPRLLTPAQDGAPRATILVWHNGEINRAGAKLASAMQSMGRASWRLSVRLQNRVWAKAALTMESTSRVTIQLSIQFKNWMGTKFAPAMERLGRSVWQLSIQFMNWVVERAGLTVKRTSRTTTQLSIRSKNWMETKAAPALSHLGRSMWRLSVRLWNRAEANFALISGSTNIAGSQLSTGLDDRAHAMQTAPGSESMGETKPQSPPGFKRWFDPRRSSRLAKPPVVAYCWTADTPHSIKIADISSGGVHLLTDVRWPRGGVLSMTLQRTDRTKEMPESWIVIDFIVMRLCKDGVAGAFIPSTHRLSRFIPSRAENCADDRTLKSFVRHLAASGRA